MRRRTRRADPRPESIPLPDGYVLVREDALRAVLREIGLTARLAALVSERQERALVDGLLPLMRAGLTDLLRAYQRGPHHPTPPTLTAAPAKRPVGRPKQIIREANIDAWWRLGAVPPDAVANAPAEASATSRATAPNASEAPQ